MEKVIYINLGGRVIPIEEKASKALEEYFAKLKKLFEKEEGCEEIMEDIEGRFSEHFQEKLEGGKACIQQAQVEEVIAVMGMPEEFEESTESHEKESSEKPKSEKRLFRNENNKIVGGVCSGIAAYFDIDPVFIRIIFALTVIGGFGIGILVYILFWIFVPLHSGTEGNDSKLFRSRNNRVLAGVAGGLAQYFGISPTIPRLIFLFPFLLSIFSSILLFPFGIPGTILIIGSFGSTMILIYIIMWIVIPEAKTRTQKMQMQGENVNIQNIIKSVKEDVKIIEEKAKKHGKSLGDELGRMGKDFEKSFHSGSDKIKSESKDFSKRAEQKAKQMEKELKESFSKQGNPIYQFFRFLGVLIMGSLFASFLVLFLASIFFSAQLEPFLGYFTYSEMDKWLFYLFIIGVPFMFFWSTGISLLRMFIGKNIALSILQISTVSMWVGLSVGMLFLSLNYSKNFRNKTLVSKEIFVVQDTSLHAKLIIKNAKKPYALNVIPSSNKLLAQGDTLFIQNISYKISQTEDSVLRVFAEAETYQKDAKNFYPLPATQHGLRMENETLFLPSYIKLQPGEKLNFKSLILHVQIPTYIEQDVMLFGE